MNNYSAISQHKAIIAIVDVDYIKESISSIFVTYPLITFMIAKIFLGEKTNWKFYFAIITGVMGVFFIIKIGVWNV